MSDLLYNLRVTQYAQLSSASIVIFEHLVTLDDEINLIWRSSWTLVKVLFLLNRYYALGAVGLNAYVLLGPEILTDSWELPPLTKSFMFVFRCTNLFKWQGLTTLVSCILADGILQMRLYALYSLDKRIVALMLTFFMIALSISGYIAVSTVLKITASAMDSPFGGMLCFVPYLLPKFYTFWIPLIAFECLLFGLALFKGFQTLRYTGSFSRKLVIILLRDSVVYFLGIGLTYVACLVFGILAPAMYLDVPIVFTVAMTCVLSNRMVLNIRVASQGFTGRSRRTLSAISFDQ